MQTSEMRFTLYYDGPLAANGNATQKQQIRDRLEPQIKELWTHSPLSLSEELLNLEEEPGDLSALHQRFGHTYASVVSEKMGLTAELDILMLRSSRPGQIIVGGDIDNRLKTLFDGLSAPAQAQQVTATARPTSATNPLFVLLDDDQLITRVSVETDRLLDPSSPDDVRLTIRVTTRIVKSMYGNMNFA